ncbi:MAG TPA: AraC family transcriptional regulator [Streptosporangiaceae bacterium]
MNSAVERAIKFICEKYGEPLSLSDVAGSAILSRFHFCRLFRDATGVTPGRFLSAVRIYQAKRMLLMTGMNVTEIAFAVGYNSLGSFSNHFTDSVGIPPGRFRHAARSGGIELLGPRREPSPASGTVTGTVTLPRGYADVRVYLGAFDTPIVQRQPASAALIEVPAADKPVPYSLSGIPGGTWFVRAVAVADNADPEPWTRRSLLVGGSGPLAVAPGASIGARIGLRPRQPTDLPILLALPDLELQPLPPGVAVSGAAPGRAS